MAQEEVWNGLHLPGNVFVWTPCQEITCRLERPIMRQFTYRCQQKIPDFNKLSWVHHVYIYSRDQCPMPINNDKICIIDPNAINKNQYQSMLTNSSQHFPIRVLINGINAALINIDANEDRCGIDQHRTILIGTDVYWRIFQINPRNLIVVDHQNQNQ